MDCFEPNLLSTVKMIIELIETHDGKRKRHDCHQIVRCGVCRDFSIDVVK